MNLMKPPSVKIASLLHLLSQLECLLCNDRPQWRQAVHRTWHTHSINKGNALYAATYKIVITFTMFAAFTLLYYLSVYRISLFVWLVRLFLLLLFWVLGLNLLLLQLLLLFFLFFGGGGGEVVLLLGLLLFLNWVVVGRFLFFILLLCFFFFLFILFLFYFIFLSGSLPWLTPNSETGHGYINQYKHVFHVKLAFIIYL